MSLKRQKRDMRRGEQIKEKSGLLMGDSVTQF